MDVDDLSRNAFQFVLTIGAALIASFFMLTTIGAALIASFFMIYNRINDVISQSISKGFDSINKRLEKLEDEVVIKIDVLMTISAFSIICAPTIC